MAASTAVLTRPLDVVEYDPAELDEYLAADAAWRKVSKAVGGPLRDRHGRMAPVPAYMRLDIQTDRNGPQPRKGKCPTCNREAGRRFRERQQAKRATVS